jgi:hypothetical protein
MIFKLFLPLFILAFISLTSRAADLTATPATLKAVFSSAQGGDRILLATGNYGQFTGGTKSGLVTIRPQAGATVVMEGFFNPASNIAFDGMTMDGLHISGATRNLTFTNIHFSAQVTFRDGTGPMNVLFDRCTWGAIDSVGYYEGRLSCIGTVTGPCGITVQNSRFGPGGNLDGIVTGVDGLRILNNEFVGLHAGSSGIHCDAFEMWGSRNTVIRGNYIHDCDSGIMAPSGVDHEIIEDNIFDIDYWYPIMMGSDKGSIIRHNTVRPHKFNNGLSDAGVMIFGAINNPTPEYGTIVTDNIVQSVELQNGGSRGTVNDWNLVNGNVVGPHDIKGLATFVGGAAPTTWSGYRLAAGSLGKNAASDGTDMGARIFGSGAPPVTTGGSIYYVDNSVPHASDSNVGSESSPWRTIQKAANTAKAGDTCLVKAGIYNERVTCASPGSSLGRVVLKAAVPRTVTTNGFVINAAYVRIEGFKVGKTALGYQGPITSSGANAEIINNYVEYAQSFGIRSYGTGALVARNKVYGCGSGILSEGDNALIENNEVDRMIFTGFDDADYSRLWGTNVTFRHNYFHGTRWADINSSVPHIDGFQSFFGGLENVMIENNWVESFHEGVMISGSESGTPSTKNIVIRNNVFIGRAEDISASWGVCIKEGSYVLNVSVYHNMFKDIQYFGAGIGSTCTGTIRNNINFNIGNSDVYFGSGGNNLIHWAGGTPSRPNSTDFIANPLLVNAANNRGPDGLPFTLDDGIRLTAGSPAINAGAALPGLVDRDLYGTSRPVNAAWDVGPHEVVGSAPSDTTPPSAPTGLMASVSSSSQINLSWVSSTDNVGVTGYRISRGGVQIAAVTGTSYQNSGLTASTAYSYAVSAIDAAGNESLKSSAASATTLSSGGSVGSGTGLTGHYFNNKDFTALARTRTDATVNFNWAGASPDAAIGADTFSARWIGRVQAATSETHTFSVVGDDGVRLWVDNRLIVDKWIDQPPTEWSGTITLTAGTKYDLRLDYYENAGGAACQLLWSTPTRAKGVIPRTQLYPPSAKSPNVAIESVSTGKAYALGIAKVDALMFIDRTYRIISLPSAQNGGVLIRTANKDKYVAVANHLTFSVNQPSVITVAYDSRAHSKPTWLKDGTWTATGKFLTATDSLGPLQYKLFTKTVAAGNVTLGGNQQGLSPVAICNYVVIVKAVVAPTANG